MLKHWLRHPLKTWHWRYMMKSNIKLNIDIDESLPLQYRGVYGQGLGKQATKIKR